MMYSYTEKYEQVKLTGYTTISCLQCGKRMKRQKTFYQTINPFNKSKLYPGELKGRSEILKELQDKIEEWKASVTHGHCK